MSRMSAKVMFTATEASALHGFLSVYLNDPDSLETSGLDRREAAAVKRAAAKIEDAVRDQP